MNFNMHAHTHTNTHTNFHAPNLMIMSLTVAYFGQLETESNKLDKNPSPIAPLSKKKTKLQQNRHIIINKNYVSVK